jgi:hypothetical protein
MVHQHRSAVQQRCTPSFFVLFHGRPIKLLLFPSYPLARSAPTPPNPPLAAPKRLSFIRQQPGSVSRVPELLSDPSPCAAMCDNGGHSVLAMVGAPAIKNHGVEKSRRSPTTCQRNSGPGCGQWPVLTMPRLLVQHTSHGTALSSIGFTVLVPWKSTCPAEPLSALV